MGKSQQQHHKDFENGPVYNKKYLKTIIKSLNGKVNANFHKHKFS